MPGLSQATDNCLLVRGAAVAVTTGDPPGAPFTFECHASALQCTVRAGHGGVQHLRRLNCRVPNHIAQEKGGSLPGWQILDRGNKREFDALLLKRRRFRAQQCWGELVEKTIG